MLCAKVRTVSTVAKKSALQNTALQNTPEVTHVLDAVLHHQWQVLRQPQNDLLCAHISHWVKIPPSNVKLSVSNARAQVGGATNTKGQIISGHGLMSRLWGEGSGLCKGVDVLQGKAE